ncbi:MAG: hypothetical protein Q7K43_03025, partial [Candidatus Woesearchaeota archaeon]|nr:hypothetical protein [Candidatus Woesearchaeota archaeon]
KELKESADIIKATFQNIANSNAGTGSLSQSLGAMGARPGATRVTITDVREVDIIKGTAIITVTVEQKVAITRKGLDKDNKVIAQTTDDTVTYTITTTLADGNLNVAINAEEQAVGSPSGKTALLAKLTAQGQGNFPVINSQVQGGTFEFSEYGIHEYLGDLVLTTDRSLTVTVPSTAKQMPAYAQLERNPATGELQLKKFEARFNTERISPTGDREDLGITHLTLDRNSDGKYNVLTNTNKDMPANLAEQTTSAMTLDPATGIMSTDWKQGGIHSRTSFGNLLPGGVLISESNTLFDTATYNPENGEITFKNAVTVSSEEGKNVGSIAARTLTYDTWNNKLRLSGVWKINDASAQHEPWGILWQVFGKDDDINYRRLILESAPEGSTLEIDLGQGPVKGGKATLAQAIAQAHNEQELAGELARRLTPYQPIYVRAITTDGNDMHDAVNGYQKVITEFENSKKTDSDKKVFDAKIAQINADVEKHSDLNFKRKIEITRNKEGQKVLELTDAVGQIILRGVFNNAGQFIVDTAIGASGYGTLWFAFKTLLGIPKVTGTGLVGLKSMFDALQNLNSVIRGFE